MNQIQCNILICLQQHFNPISRIDLYHQCWNPNEEPTKEWIEVLEQMISDRWITEVEGDYLITSEGQSYLHSELGENISR